MVKYLLSIFIIFLMLSSASFARGYDAKLKEDFGKNLTSVPFTLRFSFSEKYHKDWKKSTYAERKAFLTEYEIGLAAYEADARAQARVDAADAKDRAIAARAAARAQRDKERAQAQEAKDEARADADRNKAFNTQVADQQRDLQKMQRDMAEGNN